MPPGISIRLAQDGDPVYILKHPLLDIESYGEALLVYPGFKNLTKRIEQLRVR